MKIIITKNCKIGVREYVTGSYTVPTGDGNQIINSGYGHTADFEKEKKKEQKQLNIKELSGKTKKIIKLLGKTPTTLNKDNLKEIKKDISREDYNILIDLNE